MAKILIVDDSAVIRLKLKQILEKAGHETFEASNGKDAFFLFKTSKPDITTMDITMPDIDGITAMSNILSISPEAKIIIISSSQDRNKVMEAVDKGAKTYLVKPFETEKVLQTINKVINNN